LTKVRENQEAKDLDCNFGIEPEPPFRLTAFVPFTVRLRVSWLAKQGEGLQCLELIATPVVACALCASCTNKKTECLATKNLKNMVG
jgi:hypothetical protein